MKKKTKRFSLLAIRFLLLVTTVWACANPGSGPDGGPYDETPPRLVAMNPGLGLTEAKARKVTLLFDELIKIENATEKVIVSPPQIETPEIKVSGRRITVELKDTLLPNTTYTIDFSDAIEDANEGNPLGQFTHYFSTGPRLDTMEISGHVLLAENLEPVKGILVGLHSDTTDTAFTTRPFDRVARTDSRGYFSVKGVAPGTYRIYALKDMDGDFRYSRGEQLAFLEQTLTPSAFPDVRRDTLWRDTVSYDTILTVPFTHYLPDDVVLLSFTEKNTSRALLKSQRDVPEWFRLYFTAPSAHIPEIRGLNFDARDAFLQSRSKGNDTITYWLRDTLLMNLDTLSLTCTFEATDDSTGRPFLQTDTLQLAPRLTMEKRREQRAKELERWQKQREKRHKKGDFSDETPPVTFMKITGLSRKISPIQNQHFELEQPAMRFDTAAVSLSLAVNDSTWEPAPFRIEQDEYEPQKFTLLGEWRPGQKYRLRIDSAAITAYTGIFNKTVTQPFAIGSADDYGALFLLLPDADSTTVVQLLTSDTKVVRQTAARNKRADFFYLSPGRYYLRAFSDRNGNGLCDPGNYAEGIQTEHVCYFPSSIDVRANWDIEQTWSLNALPLNRQKPAELQKQKEEKKKTIRNRNAERERNRR